MKDQMNARTDQWNDQLSIDTPELISLDYPLAGIGSRALALLLDYGLQTAFYLLVFLAILVLPGSVGTSHPQAHPKDSAAAAKWAMAILILVPFLLHWAYFTLFESFWDGRTPGKRMMRIRVIQQSGRSLTFFEAMTRNLLRAVDFLPGFYAIGLVSIFVTRTDQRLGDLAAGTLVVHEAKQESSIWEGSAARSFTATLFQNTPAAQIITSGLPADALAHVTFADLQAIDSFLTRRLDMPLDVRATLAARLASKLRLRMQLDPSFAAMRDESFIEGVMHDARRHS